MSASAFDTRHRKSVRHCDRSVFCLSLGQRPRGVWEYQTHPITTRFSASPAVLFEHTHAGRKQFKPPGPISYAHAPTHRPITKGRARADSAFDEHSRHIPIARP